MQLRLSRRAIDDLNIPQVLVGKPAEDLVGEHELVRAFVERRSQSPTGSEAIQLPVTAAATYSLHSGRWRGLTWHDEDADVVWLLGAGYHRSGEQSDVYVRLKQRDAQGLLFPTEEDYLDLEPDATSFVQAVADEAPALIARAATAPATEIRTTIAGAVDIAITCIHERMWIAFAMPPHADAALPPEWLMITIAALFPTIEVSELEWPADLPHRAARPNEILISAPWPIGQDP